MIRCMNRDGCNDRQLKIIDFVEENDLLEKDHRLFLAMEMFCWYPDAEPENRVEMAAAVLCMLLTS